MCLLNVTDQKQYYFLYKFKSNNFVPKKYDNSE